MKRTLILTFLAAVLGSTLSGCIVVPGYYGGGGYEHHHHHWDDR